MTNTKLEILLSIAGVAIILLLTNILMNTHYGTYTSNPFIGRVIGNAANRNFINDQLQLTISLNDSNRGNMTRAPQWAQPPPIGL
jgi:hypothetical protein